MADKEIPPPPIFQMGDSIKEWKRCCKSTSSLWKMGGEGIFATAIIALSLIAGSRYAGNPSIYLLFTITANALLFNGFRRSSLYFDTLIGILFWLGFWLKLSIRVAFAQGIFHESVGAFNGSGTAFDHALLISSCAFLAILLASMIRVRLFCYPEIPPAVRNQGLFLFYQKYRTPFLMAVTILVIFIAISNLWLGIYQRGMITQTLLPFHLNDIYKWLLQFGLASFSALIIRFEIELSSQITWVSVFLPLVENFLSNVSLLSRGMILNASALGIGSIRTMAPLKEWIKLHRLAIALFAFLALFGASVFAVNLIRGISNAGYEVSSRYDDSFYRKDLVGMVISATAPLLIDRWVGMEGVMAVSSSDRLGWNLWSEAWQEKFREDELSLYDRSLIDSPYNAINKSRHHAVSLPGIVAFLYYPGSLSFLFVAMTLAGLLAAGLEVLCYRYCGQNPVLCSLFAQVIVYRYTCFGYVPAQSYLLFGSLILNGMLFYVAEHVCTLRASALGREIPPTPLF